MQIETDVLPYLDDIVALQNRTERSEHSQRPVAVMRIENYVIGLMRLHGYGHAHQRGVQHIQRGGLGIECERLLRREHRCQLRHGRNIAERKIFMLRSTYIGHSSAVEQGGRSIAEQRRRRSTLFYQPPFESGRPRLACERLVGKRRRSARFGLTLPQIEIFEQRTETQLHVYFTQNIVQRLLYGQTRRHELYRHVGAYGHQLARE